MGFFLLGSDVAYYASVCNLNVLGDLVLVDEETSFCSLNISDSLEYASYLIFHCLCPFWFVGPLCRVSVLLVFSSLWEITEFIFTGWIFTSPVVLLVCAPYSPVLCTVYVGTSAGSGLGGGIFFTWLAMILWTFIRIYLVLYLCNSGTLHVLL